MINSLAILFVSIVLEALPFVFIGTIIASVIHIFLTPKRMQQLMPKHPVLAYIVAGSMGLIIPVCECVSVPLLKQLLKKGMPMGAGITFMASAPIINPLVMLSTWYAFSHNPSIVWWRIIGGFVGAILIGVVFSKVLHYLKRECDALSHGHKTDHTHSHDHSTDTLHHGVSHFLDEFTTICGYLIVGALLASIAKVFLPISWIETLSNNLLLEIILLQVLAFLLSLCSEADAFIARTFQGMFSDASILGFLLFGPMIDFKNVMMLKMIFDWKQITVLIVTISSITGAISLLYSYTMA